MRKRHSIHTVTSIILTSGIFISSFANANEKKEEYHLSAHLGAGAAPIYLGASNYSVSPVIGFAASAEFKRWGAFHANEDGLFWHLPTNSPFGIALLVGYDEGRDESIRTLKGKNNDLKGMGDLEFSPEMGLAFSYQEGPYYIYLKGMTAVKKRNYGGEELGYTSRAELGGELSFALTETLSSTFSLSSTWGDRKFTQGHFGVTRKQARDSQFRYYKTEAGIRDISSMAVLNYQFSPSFSVQGALGGYYLLGDAGKSPLTKSRAAVITGMALSYTF